MQASHIYFITQLDTVVGLLGTIAAFLIIMALAGLAMCSEEEDEKFGDADRFVLKWWKKAVAVGVICMFLAMAIPSTKSGMYMYVLPKISSGEIVTPELAKVLKIIFWRD